MQYTYGQRNHSILRGKRFTGNRRVGEVISHDILTKTIVRQKVKNMKIIQKIRNSFEQLSPSKKKVASYFLNHYSTLYLDTVVELAEKIGVSDTTVINFCSDLGFYGYSEFKQMLKEELMADRTPPETAPAGTSDVSARMLAHAGCIADNLQITLTDSENQAALAAAVDLLASADKIYFVGFYNKAALAKSEALYLLYRGYEAEAIYPDLGDYIDHLLWAKEGSVAVMYDMAQYSSGLTEICSVLKEKNIPVILITDMGPCPRLTMANVVIHCHADPEKDSNLPPDEDVLCHSVSRLMLTALTDLHPGKVDSYNGMLREGVFTRFNPYGAIETSNNRLDRI